LGFKHHVDVVYASRCIGWAFTVARGNSIAEPTVVEAHYDGRCIGRAIANQPRPDVGSAFAGIPGSANCGFDLKFEVPDVERGIVEIEIKASTRNRASRTETLPLASLTRLTRHGAANINAAATSAEPLAPGPFPRPVMAALAPQINSKSADFSTEEGQRSLSDYIKFLATSSNCAAIPSLLDYLYFLQMTWSHFQFVSSHFPDSNRMVASGDKDFISKQTGAEEIFSIAHHLYVLKSYGVQGDFAEFGCFKGFSSAMLSYACDRLGIRMHVFDSFEGLPVSDSQYYRQGDFRGEFDEVRQNIDRFGTSRPVVFHKGYFSDTLRAIDLPPLMCLWMDVDLAQSARDVMTIAEKIDPRGAVFSHECAPANFKNGEIVPAGPSHPDDVVQPIVDGLARLKAEPAGQYVAGCTGAFWRKDMAIPIMSNAVLIDLVKSISQ
jgi:O-methyltransferase